MKKKTKDQQVNHAALLERVKKAIDPVNDCFEIAMIISKLRVHAELGFLDPEILAMFESSYIEVRDDLVENIKPGHCLWDREFDGPAETVKKKEKAKIKLGSNVWWLEGKKKKKGVLVYNGMPFSRHEICPNKGWAKNERGAFILTVINRRKRIVSPLRKLCMTGIVVRTRCFRMDGNKKVEVDPRYRILDRGVLNLLG